MSDNLGYTPGAGATVATEEYGGAHHQKVIVEWVDNAGVPQPAGTANPFPMALPSGAATAAAQAAANASLANIDADLGAQNDAAATSDVGTFSVLALIKRGLQNWTALLARVPALGQAVAAASQPVVVASDQVLPVTATGELIESIEAMRIAVQAMSRSIGQMQPDAQARMRVAIDSITAGLTLATITTITTVTTVSTLSNITSIGGNAATEQIPSLMRLGADSLRRNIGVT